MPRPWNGCPCSPPCTTSGKVNVGFQTQIWQDDQDFPTGWRQQTGPLGRDTTTNLTPVLRGEDRDDGWTGSSTALGWWWDATESWDDRCGETVCALFVAASVTPRPAACRLEGDRSQLHNSALCGPLSADLDPFAELSTAHRGSWSGGGSPLPSRTRRPAAAVEARSSSTTVLGPLHPGRLDWLQRRVVPLL